jgi:DNA-binding GntR family transcriptional regulator
MVPTRIERAIPLYQQAYQILKDKILGGVYKPGQVVAESWLAQELGISRTPVREALRQLEKDGLVIMRRYEVTIRKPSWQEFYELYLCRGALEQVVAEYAARQRDQADLDEMAQSLDAAERAIEVGDHSRVLLANTRFHDRMVAATRIATLDAILASIRGPLLLARRVVLSAGEEFERQILAEHRRLLESIVRQDVDAAKAFMQTHIANDIRRGQVQYRQLEASSS